LKNIGMTVGWEVSRASHSGVYIDAPLKRRGFGHGCQSFSVFACAFMSLFLLQ
jgi:hypothetical protein